MAKFANDLESYFSNEKLSDVVLLLCEETLENNRKRKRTPSADHGTSIAVPAHSMVLLAHSGFFKAKLENWSQDPGTDDSGRTKKHSITISVPAGQLHLAQLLIKGIYQQEPVYTDLDPAQLLQLLLLADQYEVPKVQAAVLAALQAKPASEWPWETVLDILCLPSSCAEQAECKAITESAVQQLLQQLGDLEVVWADEQLQQRLCQLPFPAMLQLVQHDETRVASEHTVAFTILRWYKEQPEATRKIKQLRQLLRQVRMQHCSQLYILTYLMRDKMVQKCFSNDELVIASLCAVELTVVQDTHSDILEKYPAWTAPARPKSSRQQLIEWHLPIVELQAVVQRHLANGRVCYKKSSNWVLQGTMVCLQVAVGEQAQSDGAQASGQDDTAIGIYLYAQGESYRVCKLEFQLAVIAVEGSRGKATSLEVVGLRPSYGRGIDFASLRVITSWQDVEVKLQSMGLIHPDGCLHLKADIPNIW